MSIQQGINQILGMSMIGGKLAGLDEKAAINKQIKLAGKLGPQIEQASKEVDIAGHKESFQGSRSISKLGDVKPGESEKLVEASNDLYKREEDYDTIIGAAQGNLDLATTRSQMLKDIATKDPSLKNYREYLASTKAIESAKGAVARLINQKENFKNNFMTALDKKLKAHNKFMKQGGKPDGK